MLVRRIKEFINQLQVSEKSSSFDEFFLQSLIDQFSSFREDDSLNEAEIACLENIFQQRWKQIADSVDDYTFDPRGINEIWIKLATDLAEEQRKSYLHILMPVVSNSIDPIILTRLTDCPELRGFYLGEDGVTLHRVRGLFERMQKKHSFSTFMDTKKYTPRPLSLRELLRIREKNGNDLKFDFSGIVYSNFWDYLKRQIMPSFQNSGECPRHLLPALVDVVEIYFLTTSRGQDLQEVRTRLLTWSKSLLEAPIDMVNYLYGQEINVGGQSVYLLEILLDCLQGKATIDAEITGIARWLAGVDPSLICKHDKLSRIYCELNIGPSLNSAQLQKILLKLDDDSSTKIRSAIDRLSVQLQRTHKIEPAIVGAFRELYRQRWTQIIGKDKDYTHQQDGVNAPWILLAQLLCGGGHIETNYYRFLMPTLTHDEDVVQREPLTAYPLSQFILSDDGKKLILLDNCVKRFKIEGTFHNGNATPTRPLSNIEIERIAYADKRFHKYIQIIHQANALEEAPISLTTVLALQTLVNDSLYPNGLLFAHDYTATQMATAEKAYQIFFEFRHKLPAIERHRLDTQRIFFNGKNKSFAEVMHEVEQDGCIAVYGLYFAKLVMDYAPYWKFRSEIEDKVAIDGMRSSSRLKVYRDYDSIDNAEALRRIRILLVSLMTRSVETSGASISAWGHSNRVEQEAHDIFTPLMLMIQSEDYKNVRSTYTNIIEKFVKPALANQSWSTWMIRSDSTKSWLSSIADESLFKQQNSWFEPRLLLATLFPLTQRQPQWRPVLNTFLDELAQLYLRPQKNSEATKISINIKFTQLLNGLSEQLQKQIFKLLETAMTAQADQVPFHKLCADLLIHRLALLGATPLAAEQKGFFGKKQSNIESEYQTIKKALMENYSDIDSTDKLIEILQSKLIDSLSFLSDRASLSRVTNYWLSMTNCSLTASMANTFNSSLRVQKDHIPGMSAAAC